jgi:hypothetical protein
MEVFFMKVEIRNPNNKVLFEYDLPKMAACAECDTDCAVLYSRCDKLGDFPEGEDDELFVCADCAKKPRQY